jgi:hypothetical protein
MPDRSRAPPRQSRKGKGHRRRESTRAIHEGKREDQAIGLRKARSHQAQHRGTGTQRNYAYPEARARAGEGTRAPREGGCGERLRAPQPCAKSSYPERKAPARKVPEQKIPESRPPADIAKLKPRDNRLLLSVPRLELVNVTIGDSPDQAYLDREGIMHLSETGFPYERGSNTYIVGHAADYDTSCVPNVFRNL